MEIQTGRLEGQAAVRQHAPHLPVQIFDHVLVLHPQHPPRQHHVPVPHHPQIGAVVAGHVVDVIDELLIGRPEQLLQIAEATGDGLAFHIDDPRLRQDQMNQADVPEIVRHLVDEEGPTVAAIDAGLGQKTLAHGADLRRRQPMGRLGLNRQAARRIAPEQFAGVTADLGQLLRPLHLGMRGQDLFDQGRTRTRQPQDEDRIGLRQAPSLARGEEVGGEGLDGRQGAGLRRLGTVPTGPTPHPVALLVPAPGGLVFGAVLHRLAQGEGQIDPVHLLQIRPCRRGLHPPDVVVGETMGLQIGQAEPGHAIVGPGGQGGAIIGHRLLGPPRDLQGVGAPQPQFGDLSRRRRRAVQQALIQVDHRLMVAQGDTGRAIEFKIVAIDRRMGQQPFGLLPRLPGLLPLQQDHGVVPAGGVIVGGAIQHAFQQGLSLVQRAGRHADTGQQTQGARIVFVPLQEVADHRLGRRQIAVGEQTVGHHHLRRQRPQRGQPLGRQPRPLAVAPHPVQLLQHVPTGGQARVQPNGLMQGLDRSGRVPEQNLAMAALLMKPAEARMLGLHARQNRQGRRNTSRRPVRPRLLHQAVALGRDGVDPGRSVHRAAPAASNGASQPGSAWSAS